MLTVGQFLASEFDGGSLFLG